MRSVPWLPAPASEPRTGPPPSGRGLLDGPGPAWPEDGDPPGPGWPEDGDPPGPGWPEDVDVPGPGWPADVDLKGPGWPPRGRGFGRPSRRVVVGLLVGASALVAARIAVLGAAAPVDARPLAVASFDGVGYGLIGVSITRRIAQRGGPALSASGTFAIVKLRLRSTDAKPHVSSTDLLSLDAGGIDYGVSSPDDIGLSDRQWGAAGGSIVVAPRRSLTVKAVFEIPVAAVGHRLRLRIGGVGYAGRTPPQTLELTAAAACCPAGQPTSPARAETIGPLADPVLGSAPPGGPDGGPVSPALDAPGFADTVRLG
jgi:hypothetical protein